MLVTTFYSVTVDISVTDVQDGGSEAASVEVEGDFDVVGFETTGLLELATALNVFKLDAADELTLWKISFCAPSGHPQLGPYAGLWPGPVWMLLPVS